MALLSIWAVLMACSILADAWRRVNHPSEVINVGETVKVQVVKINTNQRINLGMKQLETDPWDEVAANFPLNSKVTGQVTNITDYGAFVELGSGVEGLVHVSEMSWVKKMSIRANCLHLARS